MKDRCLASLAAATSCGWILGAELSNPVVRCRESGTDILIMHAPQPGAALKALAADQQQSMACLVDSRQTV